MKALSIRQPWANLIASGKKTIETRTWGVGYTGPLLIVSSKTPDIAPAGCIVAMANLVRCRWMTKADEPAACCEVYPKAHAWFFEDIRKIRPIPYKGQLGLFDITDSEILELVQSGGPVEVGGLFT